jgi:hypothetical protein
VTFDKGLCILIEASGVGAQMESMALKTIILLIIACWLPATRAQAFSQARIGQSTPLASASNLISVTLVSDTALSADAGSAITLSGLGSATSASGSSMPLLAASSGGGNSGEVLFGSQAAWGSAGLTCVLAAGQTLAAGTSYQFSFIVINPAGAQAAQTITIAASGSATLAPRAMTSDAGDILGVVGGRAPLHILEATFSTAFVSQTTPLVDVINYIILFLQPNVNVLRDSRIVISGLNASATPTDLTCFQLELFPHGQVRLLYVHSRAYTHNCIHMYAYMYAHTQVHTQTLSHTQANHTSCTHTHNQYMCVKEREKVVYWYASCVHVCVCVCV